MSLFGWLGGQISKIISKMGEKLSKNRNRGRQRLLSSKIEQQMVDALKERAASGVHIKALNSIVMKFPIIEKSFHEVRSMFTKYDKDGSGAIELEELAHCFKDLKVELTGIDVEEFYKECDMDSSKGIDFKEFIVLLALVYLLGKSEKAATTYKIGSPSLEAAFDHIVDAFLFCDKDGDGYVTKKEMVEVFNGSSPGRHSDKKLGSKRFEETDWDNDGTVTFKEFLLTFTDWVLSVEQGEDDDDDE
ncbi:hypothetical protein O6H91_07G110300 [Diphasiastrum complanatum]|uniref:Uncharacterized protein n=2 Tax=Diphasiastrum complanatum TaxID=34168 RepID=A0ACC2D913_DIPCM|nr:hypothetical protein O6H91_07G110300 [Diphasiastrum complanatum]KAJ7550629.1 hypothetical protein O6H91_07G110300 [Diphasiastrum complanatum]